MILYLSPTLSVQRPLKSRLFREKTFFVFRNNKVIDVHSDKLYNNSEIIIAHKEFYFDMNDSEAKTTIYFIETVDGKEGTILTKLEDKNSSALDDFMSEIPMHHKVKR